MLLRVVCAVMELLFSEELGLVLEVSESHVKTVRQRYSDAGVECHHIGRTCGFGPEAMVSHRAHFICHLSSCVASSVIMVVASSLLC